MAAAARCRVLAFFVLVATLTGVGAPAEAGPMPPQIPSPEQMAALTARMESTLERVRGTRSALDRVVAEYERAGEELGAIGERIATAEQELEARDAELRAAQAAVNLRAASAYRSDRLELMGVLLSARTYRQFVAALGLFRSVATLDSKNLARIRDLKADAARLREQLEAQRADQELAVRELAARQASVESSLAALGREYEKVRVELEKRRSGFAFPVRGAYSYTDTWGAPRMGGTAYAHRHEGTDIFAVYGTPVVAVVDGVVDRLETTLLGGIVLLLRSPGDDWTYFYAHLSGYAPGMRPGLAVRRGDVLGYVGNTGNARSTPPHLHFETRLPEGPPTNPYPILRRIDPLAR